MSAVEGGLKKCDFCGKPDAAWTYPCESFSQEIKNETIGEHGVRQDRTVDWRSTDHWEACDDCYTVYQEGGVEALVERVADLYTMADPTLADPALKAKVVETLTTVYERFDQHRTGNPVKTGRQ